MKKSLRVGARIKSSNTNVLKQKTMTLKKVTTSKERNNVPLSTSRWSQKDISASCLLTRKSD